MEEVIKQRGEAANERVNVRGWCVFMPVVQRKPVTVGLIKDCSQHAGFRDPPEEREQTISG